MTCKLHIPSRYDPIKRETSCECGAYIRLDGENLMSTHNHFNDGTYHEDCEGCTGIKETLGKIMKKYDYRRAYNLESAINWGKEGWKIVFTELMIRDELGYYIYNYIMEREVEE